MNIAHFIEIFHRDNGNNNGRSLSNTLVNSVRTYSLWKLISFEIDKFSSEICDTPGHLLLQKNKNS